ncbi:MAG TPA: aromatic amino acid lyase, partial [Candidatus Bathyarchaeia archaeon]
MAQVTIDGAHLSLDEVILVAREKVTVVVEKEAIARTARGRNALERSLAERAVVYGVNTGFGALSNVGIPTEEMNQLQLNLIRSHAASVGPPMDPDDVRAMMLLRANTLLKGYSGIRPEIPLLIVSLLNKQVHPYVPRKGSVGASGDLSPLSHMALVLMGEGKAQAKGRWLSGKAALEEAGHRPISLEAKEGLALNNGTQQMLGMGCLALHDAFFLTLTAEAALALSLEAINGWVDAFDKKIHDARPHQGQRTVAAHVR